MADLAFRPAQPQRWNLYVPLAQAAASVRAQRQLWVWSFLAVLALAIAGVTAALLALSRVPGVQDVFAWPLAFFEKGLVVHVVFSFVVWFLAVFGALLHLATQRLGGGRPRGDGLGLAAIAGTAIALPLLFVPTLTDRGEPTLNNYVPVIIDPLYYLGLLALAASLVLAVLRLMLNLIGRQGPLDPIALAALAGSVIYLAALVCTAIAYGGLAGQAPSFGFNEDLFWGGGHVLQFLNVGLLLVAWYVLGGIALGQPLVRPSLFSVAQGLLLVAVAVAVALQFWLQPFSDTQRAAFTWLQYALAPPALLVAGFGLATVVAARRERPLPWSDPAFACLVLSTGVFAIGGVLGIFVDGADTRTPAHYHGVIGGINLAFMGLFLALFLPLLDRAVAVGKTIRAQIWLYAVGQALACIGLFWAGGYGAPRKTAGAAQGLAELGAKIGLYLNGIGALIAVVGGVLFIVTVLAALLRKSAGR
jgi:heme/copper-type cytochrome/quinol oxidase subunit 1